MRRIYSLLAAGALVASLAGCANNFYRGRVTSQGTATAQAYHVQDGVEKAITNRYTVSGNGTATVQTVKPFLTLDGAWTPDVTPGAQRVVEEDGSVVIRGAPPVPPVVSSSPPRCPPPPSCSGPECAPPGVAAAPSSRCGEPVYRGCDGTPGGNRPTASTYEEPPIPPGTGWPCDPELGATVMGVALAPPGFFLHLGECFVNFVGCVFSFP